MIINKQVCTTFVAFALTTSAGYAETTEPSKVSFSGFGTLGAVHSSETKADVIGSVSQPNGAGYARQWSADVDSKLGVQMNANFTDQLSAVVQIVSEHRYDNRYTPQVEWANIKYQVTPDLDVRLGRTVDTLYLQSDIRLVGYAYPWVRRPREIYGLIPVAHKDGIDASYRYQIGDVSSSIQTSYGKTTLKLPNNRQVKVNDIFTLSNTFEYGAGALRLGYTSLKATYLSTTLDGYFSDLRTFGNALSAIPSLQPTGAKAIALADKYKFSNSPYSVITVGATYDPGNWLLMGEWAKTPTSPALVPRSTAWYVAGAYRFNKLTPYVSYAHLEAAKVFEPGIPTAGLPPSLAFTASRLNFGLSLANNSFTFAQKDLSMGVRWDFMKSVDLKFQYDRLKTTQGTTGLLGNIQPNFQPGQNINVISATMDFVF